MDMRQWIRAARLHAGMTQEQLGDALGVTKGNVSAWENGRHTASHEQLVKVAQVTGFSEPMPGLSASVEVAHRWPFSIVSHSKVLDLSPDDRVRLETAMLLCAAQLGLDIKK